MFWLKLPVNGASNSRLKEPWSYRFLKYGALDGVGLQSDFEMTDEVLFPRIVTGSLSAKGLISEKFLVMPF